MAYVPRILPCITINSFAKIATMADYWLCVRCSSAASSGDWWQCQWQWWTGISTWVQFSEHDMSSGCSTGREHHIGTEMVPQWQSAAHWPVPRHGGGHTTRHRALRVWDFKHTETNTWWQSDGHWSSHHQPRRQM